MSEPKPTPTPRTDSIFDHAPTANFWWPDFARTLERELAEQTQAAKDATDFNSELLKECATERAELAALKLKLEVCRNALDFITRCKDPIESTGYVMQEKAREALSQLNESSHLENVSCTKCGKWASLCICDGESEEKK